MAQEKEAFGFYFSAHPVDRYRHLAEARGAKSYGAICAEPVAEGGRANGVMAAMVEDVRWRETRRGARYAAATFSESSGQFQVRRFAADACKRIRDEVGAGDLSELGREWVRE